MNIIIVTPRIPYPPHRGDKLKIFNISRILSIKNKIHIITFYRKKKDKELVQPLEQMGIKISLIKLTLLSSFINTFLAVFQNIPFQVAWYKSSKLKSEISKISQNNKFDVVYYHLIRSAQFLLPESINNINILDFTDAVSLYLSRMEKSENNYFKKIFIRSELNRIKRYEKIAEKFDSVFVCSEIDKKFLLDKGLNIEIQTLKNGIDTKYFTGFENNFNPKRIIFTGNMPYYANSDAVQYFSKNILPLILKEDYEVKFYIVGQNPTPKIKRLNSESIIVTGFVEDIRNEYLKSAVNIAPMRFGAGTLNKIIESIALGVPVVATSLAVMGLPNDLKKYVFIADSETDFAMQVLYIMKNPNIRYELMKEGQAKIIKELSWDSIVSDFEGFLLRKIKTGS